MTAAVLAVDGGNSKTEVALVDHRAGGLGVARGPGSNHVHSDHASVMALVDSLVARALAGASGPRAEVAVGPVADVAVLCLAGADYPSDERHLAAAAAGFG
jgi:N-acetylglucosamine kinase-like BadF-type ATPase